MSLLLRCNELVVSPLRTNNKRNLIRDIDTSSLLLLKASYHIFAKKELKSRTDQNNKQLASIRTQQDKQYNTCKIICWSREIKTSINMSERLYNVVEWLLAKTRR